MTESILETQSLTSLIEFICTNLTFNASSDTDSKVIKLHTELDELSVILGVSIKSSLLFCQFFDLTIKHQSTISIEHLNKYDINFFALSKLSNQLEELISKGLLLRRQSMRDSIGFSIPTSVMNAILFNKHLLAKSISGISNNRFYRIIKKIFDQYEKNEMEFLEFHAQLKVLVESNPELPLPKLLESIDVSNGFFLIAMCNQVFEYGNSSMSLNEFLWQYNNLEFDNLYTEDKPDEIDFSKLENELKSSSSQLLTKEIIRNKKGESFKTIFTYELNPKYKDVLFKDVHLLFDDESDFKGNKLIRIVPPQEIPEVELVYDDETSERLNEFKEYFTGDNMKMIMDRYAELGIQPNFCSILSGPSGTGKSEWIQQLARETNRKLYVINLSEIKNCYVGVSEKNIQSIFDEYGKCVDQVMNAGGDSSENRIPIMVIDEAEILMNDRSKFSRRSSSVDEMHKMMVNILLKNLEGFRGILLLSSNHVANIDPALSRRINYKFTIPNPSANTRGKILNSVLKKWFSMDECILLGNSFELNGGMIKNIHQKVINHYVLKDSIPSMKLVENWSQEEVNGWKGTGKRKIGYC